MPSTLTWGSIRPQHWPQSPARQGARGQGHVVIRSPATPVQGPSLGSTQRSAWGAGHKQACHTGLPEALDPQDRRTCPQTGPGSKRNPCFFRERRQRQRLPGLSHLQREMGLSEVWGPFGALTALRPGLARLPGPQLCLYSLTLTLPWASMRQEMRAPTQAKNTSGAHPGVPSLPTSCPSTQTPAGWGPVQCLAHSGSCVSTAQAAREQGRGAGGRKDMCASRRLVTANNHADDESGKPLLTSQFSSRNPGGNL